MKLILLLLCLPCIAFAESDPAAPTHYLKFWHDNDFTGNDYGYTGGLDLEVGVFKDQGWSYFAHFYSSLNSQRVLPYGDPNHLQYQAFTDWAHAPAGVIALPKGVQDERIEQNSLLSFGIEHCPSESVWAWRVEAGLTQTESNSAYIPGAAGWQATWHHLIGATKEEIISDGKSARYGVFVKPMLMGTFPIILTPALMFQLQSDLGGSVDTEGQRRYLFISQGFAIGSGVLKLDSRAEAQLSALHKQVVLRETLSLYLESLTLFVEATPVLTSTGYSNLFDTDYVDNDLTMKLGIVVPFSL